MANKGRRFPFLGSTRAFQESVTRSAPAAGAAYSMLGGLLVLGAVGYGVDRWAGTEPWGLVAGLFLGMVVGFYELVKLAYRK